MAKLNKLPNAQWPITAVFEFSFSDSMNNDGGVESAFSAVTAGTVFPLFSPPPGAHVIGGTIQNVTAWVGPTASTIDLGDSGDPDRFTPTVHDLKSATLHSVLTPAGAASKVYNGSETIDMTLINTVAPASAGKTVISVSMVVPARASENLKTT